MSDADSDFENEAQRVLERIEAALEASGVDADFEMKEGGVLEVEFPGGAKLIVNRHGAAREIWVAARAGGFHYRREDGVWRDTRGGEELFAALSRLVSELAGRRVALTG